MVNQEIARIFNDMARFLQMEGVAFKPYAFERAALSLQSLKEDVSAVYRTGGKKALLEIPGIGKSLADHIEEYLKTGKIKDYEKFKSKMPLKMDDLIRVEGLGPKKIKILYQKLGISDLKSLEKAVKAHEIAPLFGFGEKTEKNIQQGLEFLKRDKGRFHVAEILPIAKNILRTLEDLPEVERVSLAGSLRRMKETIGDVDFLVVSKNPKKTMEFFVNLPGVEKVWGKGGTKASVRMANGFDMDLRVVPKQSYGAALQYFTGNKDHNIQTRKIAIDKGFKLSEYGLFEGKKIIASTTEEEVYEKLGMAWPAPELRENNGEIEVSLQGKLPQLLELKDIKGDLHVHSNWEDSKGGKDSIEVLAKTAMARGYEYIGISDHTNDLKIERGLNEKELLEENAFIKKLNEKFKDLPPARAGGAQAGKNFRILHGCEANIRRDGSIDVKDEVLAQLDYVIVGIHSLNKMDKKEMTDRIITAMRNPHVDIISHPTGRIVGRREEYQHDFDQMLKAAKETGTILEINASERLDLRDLYIRRAKQEGVKMIINTDSHQKEQMDLMEYGVAQARRGWAEPHDIINTRSVEELLKFFE